MTSTRNIVGIMLLVLAAPVMAADENPIQQLTALLDRFLAGASSNDIDAHERFWSDELVYTSSNGTRFGKADILDGMRAAATSQDEADDADATVYTAEDVDIRVYGDMAVVAFRLVGTSANEVQQYFNTGTFLLRGGEWKAVAWQATKIPEHEDSD